MEGSRLLWPYLYDLILIAIFVVTIRRGWRTGFLSSLFRLSGWLVAILLIVAFSQRIAVWVFENLLYEKVVSAVSAAIPQDVLAAVNSGAAATQETLDALQTMLDSLGGILGSASISTDSLREVLDLMRIDGQTLAQAITDSILRPLVVTAVQVAASVAIFLVCVWLFKLLSRLFARHHSSRGAIGGLGSALGAVLGFGEGLATNYVYAFVLSALAELADGRLSFLSRSIYDSTMLVHRLVK